MPRTTVIGATARPIHAAAQCATRAIRQAREWTAVGQRDDALQLAERLLDELATYATLRTDAEVPAGQAQERLTQFLDNLLQVA